MESISGKLGLNTAFLNWVVFFVLAIVSYYVLRQLFRFATHRIKLLSEKTATQIDDLVFAVLNRTSTVFYATTAVSIAAYSTDIPAKASNLISKIFIVVSLLQVAMWSTLVVSYFVEKFSERHGQVDDGSHKMIQGTFQFAAKLVVWVLCVLLILDNLGVNISALIAGLGIGGIAVALALQNILGDLFASLSIILDKPFVLNDFIVVGDKMGTVERIGVKTTRLRALGGEQLVFTNNDLLQSRIQNFKRMQERRIEFKFGVIYQTPPPILRKIPDICKSIITSIQRTRFDRAHFAAFGNSDLSFTVVYYVLSAEFGEYMDIQQKINFELFESFQKLDIQFAYPTQTVFIDGFVGNTENQNLNSTSF